MRSKLHIAGHPLHPMLIPLPVAASIFALASDIVGMAAGSPRWLFTAYLLTIAAWASGALAAIPGLVDYIFVVPRKTKAMVYATLHLIFNLSIVGLFFASWLVKNSETYLGSSFAPLILEIIGVALLFASGWFGWTLVYKHRLGVDEAPQQPREESRKVA